MFLPHFPKCFGVTGCLASCLVLLALAIPGFALDRGLDPTFGTDGKVTTAGGWINGLALQPDDKIVAAGTMPGHGGALVRYNPDGSLDSSFGSGGIVRGNPGLAVWPTQLMSVALQLDGKIVAVGYKTEGDLTSHTLLMRCNPDGSLDSGFGGTGLIVIKWSELPGGEFNVLRSVVIQPDGKILAGGNALIGTNPDCFALVRVNSDGSPDTSFGQGGKVLTQIYATRGGTNPGIWALALQADGMIIAGGFALNEAGTHDPIMARYHPDGSLDGIMHIGLSYHNGITALALQPDGKIVAVTGYIGPTMNLFRYRPAGGMLEPDPSFGYFGMVTVPYAQGYGIVLQPDGRIVVGGVSQPPQGQSHTALWRFDPDGGFDPAFGDGVVTDFFPTAGTGYEQRGGSLVRQPDGKVVWGGWTDSPSSGYCLSLAHFTMDITPVDGFVRWKYKTYGSICSSPAIGDDGTIYVGNSLGGGNGHFWAFKPNGNLKWNYQFPNPGERFSSPAIGGDGTIYVGNESNGHLYAIQPDGSLKWTYPIGGSMTASPAIGGDGTIYMSNGNLYALNPDGTLKWKYPLGPTEVMYPCFISPTIGGDTIYVSSHEGFLFAFHANGTLKWKMSEYAGFGTCPAIGRDGTIYVGGSSFNGYHKYLFAINPNGTVKWKHETETSLVSSPAIGPDGTIHVGAGQGNYYLQALNPDGTLKWQYPTGNCIFSSPAIGADGTIFVGSYDGCFYALNPDGTLRWKYATWLVLSSPVIGKDGTVYVGSDDGYFFAFNSSCGGLADSPWPMFRRDVKHTGLGAGAVPLPPLLVFYPFEGNAQDVSGNNRNGAVVGATLTGAGYEGQAYSFNGTNSYIMVPLDISPSQYPQLTIGAWAKAASPSNPRRQVLSQDDGGFDRSLLVGDTGWGAFCGSGWVLCGDPVVEGKWVFLAAVYDQAAGTVKLWVGDKAYTKTGATLGAGTNMLRIGMNPGWGEYFSGIIDNVFIFNGALTDAQIASIRTGGSQAILARSGNQALPGIFRLLLD